MYSVTCSECNTIYECYHADSICPRCHTPNLSTPELSDTEKKIEEIGKNNSPLSLQVADAESHIAIGLAGLENIMQNIDGQREHLREGAKKFIALGKCSGFDREKFEEFLDNAIMVDVTRHEHIEDLWQLTYPSFIKLDLYGCFLEGKQAVERYKNKGYKTVMFAGEPPMWIKHLYHTQEMNHENNVELNNEAGD